MPKTPQKSFLKGSKGSKALPKNMENRMFKAFSNFSSLKDSLNEEKRSGFLKKN